MTVHFYTKENITRPASRQRAFLVAKELNACGVKAVVHWPPVEAISETRWPKKFVLIVAIVRSLFSIKKGDIVFLQRTISNKYFFVIMVVYLKLFRRKTIFDFDDAIYKHSFFKTKVFTRMASAVIICSRHLEMWVKQYNPNVYIIHTSLKFAEYVAYTKDYKKEERECVIGWIGTATNHADNLAFLAVVLAKLCAKIDVRFRFVLVGAVHSKKTYELFRAVPGLDTTFVDNIEWDNPAVVAKNIQQFDIGVMPLVNRGEWNRARSSYKLFEYMACGVASLSSDVGEVTYVIQDGENGFFAETAEQWVQKLGKLVLDRDLRARIGHAGQETIRTQEAYEAVIPRLITIIKAL